GRAGVRRRSCRAARTSVDRRARFARPPSADIADRRPRASCRFLNRIRAYHVIGPSSRLPWHPIRSNLPPSRPGAPIGQAPPVFLFPALATLPLVAPVLAGRPADNRRVTRSSGRALAYARIPAYGDHLVRAHLHPVAGQGRRG